MAALLRPGNQGAARHSVAVLRRIVKRIRQVLGSWVQIEIRADSGFATPEIYEYCEQEGLTYTLGLARNPRLEAAVQGRLHQSQQAFALHQEKQRDFTGFFYRAQNWDRSRRVVAKVEVNSLGINRRFVVTNRRDLPPAKLYHQVHRPRPDRELHQSAQERSGHGSAQAFCTSTYRGVTSQNGKIIREEPSEWLRVANNGPFPPHHLALSS